MTRRTGRRGMSTLQAVMLLGAGFLMVWGLMGAWTAAEKPAVGNMRKILDGETRGGGNGSSEYAQLPPEDTVEPPNETVIRPRPLPTTTIPGVTEQPDGRVVSTPVTENADGLGNFVTNEEQGRNINAVEVAVANSPLGIAVVAGDHTGWLPSGIDFGGRGFDHVAIAYRDGDRVRILEMIPDEQRNELLRNLGLPGPGSRDLDTFARGYDTVHALPVSGLTPEQATRFLNELRTITAEGETFGFLAGQVCSTAIAEALTRAGVPHQLDPSTGPFNDLLPRSVLEEFERLRGTDLGRQQLRDYAR